jgi:hypothetical protein
VKKPTIPTAIALRSVSRQAAAGLNSRRREPIEFNPALLASHLDGPQHKLGCRSIIFFVHHAVQFKPAPMAAPEDVAFFLASYAREALARIEIVGLEPLKAVRSALEEALGLKFEGEKGEHFFRSSLVQTLFYGVFSAWVLWARKHPPASKERFDWNLTARLLKVPVIRKLVRRIAAILLLTPALDANYQAVKADTFPWPAS